MKSKLKFSDKELKEIGFRNNKLLKSAAKTVASLIRDRAYQKIELIQTLKDILQHPEKYLETPFQRLAQDIIDHHSPIPEPLQSNEVQELKPNFDAFPVFGGRQIDSGAVEQMNTAMRLPVSLAGALMPDAHQGYGLPIGGVLATSRNAVIPFAVGVDIACRMCLSVFEIDALYLEKNQNKFKNLLLKNTCFGTGKGFKEPWDDALFEKDIWRSSRLLRELKPKAISQIGSSGTGNHFVEWGIITLYEDNPEMGIPKGKYLGLLSHSGSRGLGAAIATYYSKLAMKQTLLPEEAKHLAWLDLNTEAGQEYWIGMELAGEYASANHHHIHGRMAKDLALKPLAMVENHHNFAWKEQLKDGTDVIVHRKGATPAQLGEMGIIPASMTQPGYLVKGKGFAEALNSASHGAGRMMSRGKALKSITQQDLQKVLADNGVMLIGGDLDEAPMAYKNIEMVMKAQEELVEIIAKFSPKIVRMAERERFSKKGKDTFAES